MSAERVEYEYRIELLTSELEKSSEILQQKNIECEEYRLKAVQLDQKLKDFQNQYDQLNRQYIDLSETLRIKVIENEDLKSRYNRVTQITLKDYEDKIEKLVTEIEKLNDIILQKAQDVESTRSQCIAKIQELQEERQKIYHLDNFIKTIKNEKLEALHFLNEKTKETDDLKEKLQNAQQYKFKSDQLEKDIENIRMNYTSLFEQHLEEIQKLKIQIDTQRQINENNLTISEEKYITLLQSERSNIQKEVKEKVATAIIQMENQIATQNNLLEAKQNEIEKLRLQRHNLETEKTNSLLIDKNIQIQEYHQKMINLERQLHEKTATLDQLQNQVSSGQLIPATSQTLLERSFKQLQEELHKQHIEMGRLQSRCLELQEELQKKANLKTNYEGQLNTLLIEIANLKKELLETNRKQNSNENEQRLQRRIIQLEREKNSSDRQHKNEMLEQDQKIRYLLELLEQKNNQHQQQQQQQFIQENRQINIQGNIYPNPSQLLQAIIEESNSRVGQSNIFYHEEDSQDLR